MSELTYIKGKDACLENSIANMQATLHKMGFEIKEASWLNPVTNVFSLHILDKRCPGLFTNGKGTSRKSTLASALGEFLERLSTNYFFSDYWLENPQNASNQAWLYYPDEKRFTEHNIKECLTPELWSFYDSTNELGFNELLSFNDSQESVGAIRLVNAHTGENVYFPMNLLSNLYASNGLSAGNTALEAQVQGLSEIFERWVKNKILRENLCLPEIPNEIVKTFPAVVEAVKALEEAGIEVSMRDASLGGLFPVINVTLFEQKTGFCFASFGAHPIFEVALERTLTESLQGRHLDNLDGFQMPVFDEFAVAEDENIENHFIDSSGLIHANFISKNYDFEFVNWDFSEDTKSQWDRLCELVKSQGTEVFVANYNHCGFETCRIVVPGMSEVYPTEELIESNQNVGRLLREALLELPISQDYIGLVELIDALGLSDHQGVASLIGLMPDPGTFWAEVKVVELKFWALLAAQEVEEAFEVVQDVVYYVNPNSQWILKYNALKFSLEMLLQDCVDKSSTELLFGKELSDQAWLFIAGNLVFDNQKLGTEIFTTSHRHQALLEIYAQAQANKLALNGW
ncbi:30S ribosomal protein S12 methylthiotransferase accessory factor YcaO [Thiomicrorhabdus sp. Kp2]|uniref:30S ribosomal protein S12 methylthiotransferase accessory factor YcaO n=1 Tax=Thiomicrorhabdus sp. Kp2 TaxID=1123518 RepID=UPI00041EDDF8|nr:30S ribosomal protein S12 methylthiotransferase accessory factor YcaO [Thiomicrorhabdus sp. Kp2]